jgi:hypothetical protein
MGICRPETIPFQDGQKPPPQAPSKSVQGLLELAWGQRVITIKLLSSICVEGALRPPDDPKLDIRGAGARTVPPRIGGLTRAPRLRSNRTKRDGEKLDNRPEPPKDE